MSAAVEGNNQPWDDQRLALIASWRKSNPGRIPSLNRSDRMESHVCRWLALQGRREDLSPTETVLLNRTFPDWRKVRISTFDLYLYEACVFADLNGRLPSAKSTDPNERKLGEWVARKASRSKDGALLLPEYRSLTRSLPGWSEASPGEGRVVSMPRRMPIAERKAPAPRTSWDDRMGQMEDFYHEAHRIPVRMKPDEQVLADWLAVQQTKIASGALPVDRAYRLMVLIDDDPSVMLQPNGREFDTWLQSLRSSYASRGITSMIYPSDAGVLLWEWRETMSLFYRRGELSAEQVEALDSVDTAWKERHRG